MEKPEPPLINLRIENRSDLSDVITALEDFGQLVLGKGNYPSPHYSDAYHIGNATVKLKHNSPCPHGPYYAWIRIYGTAPDEFMGWVEKHMDK